MTIERTPECEAQFEADMDRLGKRIRMGEVQLYVRSMGRMLLVSAIFTDTDAANRWMEGPNNDAVVACTPGRGLILLADKGDRGLKVEGGQS